MGSLMPTIAQQGYFVIHAPRQVGKTTAMLAQDDLAEQQARAEQQGARASLVALADGGDEPRKEDLSHPYYWAPFILIGNGL